MSFDWTQLEEADIKSVNEAKSSSQFELPPVPDGDVQAEIVEISPRLENKFAKPGQLNDRRGITFLIVDSDDPDVVGKKFKQYFNLSSHPKSAMYPLWKAVMGGSLDPEYKPRLADLANKQVKGVLITKERDDGTEAQVFESIRVAKTRVDAPPF